MAKKGNKGNKNTVQPDWGGGGDDPMFQTNSAEFDKLSGQLDSVRKKLKPIKPEYDFKTIFSDYENEINKMKLISAN